MASAQHVNIDGLPFWSLGTGTTSMPMASHKFQSSKVYCRYAHFYHIHDQRMVELLFSAMPKYIELVVQFCSSTSLRYYAIYKYHGLQFILIVQHMNLEINKALTWLWRQK